MKRTVLIAFVLMFAAFLPLFGLSRGAARTVFK